MLLAGVGEGRLAISSASVAFALAAPRDRVKVGVCEGEFDAPLSATAPVGMLMTDDSRDRQKLLYEALRHLRSGLDLLDQGRAPGHIGAHVDLAIVQLEQTLSSGPNAPVTHSDANCEKFNFI
jgi:hypothetical protein